MPEQIVDLRVIADQLLEKINPNIQKIVNGAPPTLFLAFDEAHTILETITTNGVQWSQFSALRRALRAIRLSPIWSLFLSTTGKLEQFAPAPVLDDSNRIVEGRLVVLTPFSALGFDLLAEVLLCHESYSLDHVSSLEYKLSLGRPM
jgi:hypothetical protein